MKGAWVLVMKYQNKDGPKNLPKTSLPGASHVPMLSKPDVVLDVIR